MSRQATHFNELMKSGGVELINKLVGTVSASASEELCERSRRQQPVEGVAVVWLPVAKIK